MIKYLLSCYLLRRLVHAFGKGCKETLQYLFRNIRPLINIVAAVKRSSYGTPEVSSPETPIAIHFVDTEQLRFENLLWIRNISMKLLPVSIISYFTEEAKVSSETERMKAHQVLTCDGDSLKVKRNSGWRQWSFVCSRGRLHRSEVPGTSREAASEIRHIHSSIWFIGIIEILLQNDVINFLY